MLVVGLLTAAVEVGILYLSYYLGGDDKRTFLPFALAFPVAFVFTVPFLHAWIVAIIAMLAQFPVYGYFVGQAWMRGHLGRTFLRLSLFHLVFTAVSVCSLLINRA